MRQRTAHPFRSVGGAVAFDSDGSELRMSAGTYSPALTINKRVRLSANGDVVRIGGSSQCQDSQIIAAKKGALCGWQRAASHRLQVWLR